MHVVTLYRIIIIFVTIILVTSAIFVDHRRREARKNDNKETEGKNAAASSVALPAAPTKCKKMSKREVVSE